MGKIKASLADVSTEFQLVDPGVYVFEVKKITDVENQGKYENLESDDNIAYRVLSEVVESDDPEQLGRAVSEYINVEMQDKENPGNSTTNEIGLQTLKRYFEACFGKDEVAGWTDDDYDTDRLLGQRFRGQVKIGSYTKKGETEPRKTNEFQRIESI